MAGVRALGSSTRALLHAVDGVACYGGGDDGDDGGGDDGGDGDDGALDSEAWVGACPLGIL